MGYSFRRIVLAGTGLLVARAALPSVLTWLTNFGVRKIPGYRGSVKRVGIDLTVPSVIVQGLSLKKFNGSEPHQFLDVRSVIVGSKWKKIFAGALDGYLRLESPRLFLDLEGFGGKAERTTNKAKPNGDSKITPEQQPWQEKVKGLPAFRLSSAVLTDGEVHLQGILGQNRADIKIDRLSLCLENIANSIKISPTLMAKASCEARVMSNGKLKLRAEGYPLAALPTFNVDFETSNVDLTELSALIEKNAR